MLIPLPDGRFSREELVVDEFQLGFSVQQLALAYQVAPIIIEVIIRRAFRRVPIGGSATAGEWVEP